MRTGARLSVRSSSSCAIADGFPACVFCPDSELRPGPVRVAGPGVFIGRGGIDGSLMGCGCAISDASAVGSSLGMPAAFM